MVRFYYPKVSNGALWVCINDESEKFFEYLDNWSDKTRQAGIKKVWSHCRRLARQYARRHGMKCEYTSHPSKPQAVWAVV